MRVPPMLWVMRYMRGLGLVAAGMVIGAACFMAVYNHNFSLLYMENQKYRAENEELRKALEPHQQNRQRQSAVRQIKLQLESAPGTPAIDEITSVHLRRKLAGDLDAIRGRPVDTAVDALLAVKNVIERKVYTIDQEEEYTLELPLMLIRSGELTIWAEARPYVRTE